MFALLNGKVNGTLILPNSIQDNKLSKLTILGLDAIKWAALPTSVPQPEYLPYSDAPYIRPVTTLYGAALDSIPNEITWSERYKLDSERAPKQTEVGEVNLFNPVYFEALPANNQIIEYARYTCRLVDREKFDIIYASDWRTYLAGTELKLITGKKLVLQVNTLSYERNMPKNEGWMFELEKQAFSKADFLIVANWNIATILQNQYDVKPSRLCVMGERPNSVDETAEDLPKFINLAQTLFLKNKRSGKVLGKRKEIQPTPSPTIKAFSRNKTSNKRILSTTTNVRQLNGVLI